MEVRSTGMRLRQRILSGFGIALALTAVVLAWAVVHLINLGDASDAILRENYRSILAAENMIDAIERQDSAILLVTLGYRDDGVTQFRENENHFLQWLGRAKDNITIDGEAEVLSAIETRYSDYLVEFTRLRDLTEDAPDKAGGFYHETVLPVFKTIRDDAIRLRDMNHDTMFAASRRTREVATTAIGSTIVVGAVAVILGLVFSLLLSKRLVRPIAEMTVAVDALSEGDYAVRVPTGGADELSQLGNGFNSMATKLGRYHSLNLERLTAEQRRSEAVLRSIDDGVVVVDAALCVVNLNPRAAGILSVEPDAAVGHHFLEVVRNDRLFEWVKQTVESGAAPKIEEGKDMLTVGSGDSARHYLFAITPVLAKSGGLIGVVLLLRDVTRLKELDRLKSEFVMTASHELKTPLQSLGMSIELLREGAADSLDDKQRRLLDAASEEMARLKSLIADLLDLSRIEAGKLELDIASVPPAFLVEKAVEVFRGQAETKHIDLTVEVPSDLPQARADANKITWILTNLIANAMRYADSRICVAAKSAGPWIEFSVSDDGEGIPPEMQSRIFEKFVQVKSEKSVGGTGLGLAICKEIVRAHKGTIWVDAAQGRGSTFSFTIPTA